MGGRVLRDGGRCSMHGSVDVAVVAVAVGGDGRKRKTHCDGACADWISMWRSAGLQQRQSPVFHPSSQI